jgi:putative cell wall-binding protein
MPGSTISLFYVGILCSFEANLEIDSVEYPLEAAGFGDLGWAVGHDQVLPEGVTGAGTIFLSCSADGGEPTYPVSVPIRVTNTQPASTYRTPSMFSVLPSDGTEVTVNKVGYVPGESVMITVYDQSLFEAEYAIADAMAAPVTVVADGEGAITTSVAVPDGWSGGDSQAIVSSATSRLLYDSLWESGSAIEIEDAEFIVSPTASPGGSATVSGSGYAPGEDVVVALHSDSAPAVVLATKVASGSGAISGSVAIPPSTASGAYRVWAGSKTGSYLLLNAPLTVGVLPDAERISGADRFATAAAVAEEFAEADVVFVANGRNYPDALSAAPAAAFLAAPLLLTERDSLPGVIAEQIQRLGPDRIVVVGGTGVISTSVASQLEALLPGTQVDRLGGADRYETSRVVTADAFGDTGAADAFIATGTNFPDALSASAAAGAKSAPVILVNGSAPTLDLPTLDLLDDLGVDQAYLAGGPAVVSNGILGQLAILLGDGNATRLAGPDRYGTSIAINTSVFDESDVVYLAVGTGYADALAGAALAGKNLAPLFIVPGTCVPQLVLDAIVSFGADEVVLLGGVNALSSAVAELTPCE